MFGRRPSQHRTLASTRKAFIAMWLLPCLLLTGCATELHSPESALSPAGPQAARISTLLWLTIILCGVIYLAVMVALVGSVLHRRRGQTMGPTNDPVLQPDP